MPYAGYDDGIYSIKQKKGLIWHWGVLDIGNLLENIYSDGSHPIVWHKSKKTKDGLYPDVSWLRDTGSWELVKVTTDISDAKKRLNKVLSKPRRYHLLENNCEHFANYVVQGVKVSGQVKSGAIVVLSGLALGLLAYEWYKSNEDKNR